jgi:hypothetical protein
VDLGETGEEVEHLVIKSGGIEGSRESEEHREPFLGMRWWEEVAHEGLGGDDGVEVVAVHHGEESFEHGVGLGGVEESLSRLRQAEQSPSLVPVIVCVDQNEKSALGSDPRVEGWRTYVKPVRLPFGKSSNLRISKSSRQGRMTSFRETRAGLAERDMNMAQQVSMIRADMPGETAERKWQRSEYKVSSGRSTKGLGKRCKGSSGGVGRTADGKVKIDKANSTLPLHRVLLRQTIVSIWPSHIVIHLSGGTTHLHSDPPCQLSMPPQERNVPILALDRLAQPRHDQIEPIVHLVQGLDRIGHQLRVRKEIFPSRLGRLLGRLRRGLCAVVWSKVAFRGVILGEGVGVGARDGVIV